MSTLRCTIDVHRFSGMYRVTCIELNTDYNFEIFKGFFFNYKEKIRFKIVANVRKKQ